MITTTTLITSITYSCPWYFKSDGKGGCYLTDDCADINVNCRIFQRCGKIKTTIKTTTIPLCDSYYGYLITSKTIASIPSTCPWNSISDGNGGCYVTDSCGGYYVYGRRFRRCSLTTLTQTIQTTTIPLCDSYYGYLFPQCTTSTAPTTSFFTTPFLPITYPVCPNGMILYQNTCVNDNFCGSGNPYQVCACKNGITIGWYCSNDCTEI